MKTLNENYQTTNNREERGRFEGFLLNTTVLQYTAHAWEYRTIFHLIICGWIGQNAAQASYEKHFCLQQLRF